MIPILLADFGGCCIIVPAGLLFWVVVVAGGYGLIRWWERRQRE